MSNVNKLYYTEAITSEYTNQTVDTSGAVQAILGGYSQIQGTDDAQKKFSPAAHALLAPVPVNCRWLRIAPQKPTRPKKGYVIKGTTNNAVHIRSSQAQTITSTICNKAAVDESDFEWAKLSQIPGLAVTQENADFGCADDYVFSAGQMSDVELDLFRIADGCRFEIGAKLRGNTRKISRQKLRPSSMRVSLFIGSAGEASEARATIDRHPLLLTNTGKPLKLGISALPIDFDRLTVNHVSSLAEHICFHIWILQLLRVGNGQLRLAALADAQANKQKAMALLHRLVLEIEPLWNFKISDPYYSRLLDLVDDSLNLSNTWHLEIDRLSNLRSFLT